MRIEAFNGEYRFLSNFWPAHVRYEGQGYPSVEHAYQAAKTLNLHDRRLFQGVVSAGEAKKLGRTLQLRPDWERIKLAVMAGLLYEKFEDPVLRQRLLATGDAEIIEGNYWGDTYWGVCRGKGQNNLGKLLMGIRAHARTTK